MKEKDLIKYLLPKGILEYFDVEECFEEADAVHIKLEEKNIVPSHIHGATIISKGFFPEREILDFPIRDKAMILHIKRRRWMREDTKEEVTREISLIAEGTKYTQEFADFLKGAD